MTIERERFEAWGKEYGLLPSLDRFAWDAAWAAWQAALAHVPNARPLPITDEKTDAQAEPVAWQLLRLDGSPADWIRLSQPIDDVDDYRPLYAAPQPAAQGEPFVWAWRGKQMARWVCDPSNKWREEHKDDPDIEWMPLYAGPQPATAPAAVVDALRDVAAERERQKSVEGWTEEHDDDHDGGDLCAVAAHYAIDAAGQLHPHMQAAIGDYSPFGQDLYWPWARKWWKPGDARRNLVKAGALILAEIERLDRAALAAQEGKE